MISDPSSAELVPKATVWRDLLLLAIVFGTLSFLLLGRAPLANPDEGRYAEIPREMLTSGDWITPRLNGVNYFEKPPLVYWAIAASMSVLGENEWAVRVVPALVAVAGVLLTFLATSRLFDRRAGLAAASVLGLSLFYFVIARIVLLDMAVTLLISATLFCFILGIHEPPGVRRRTLFHGLYVAAALATLTKGLIGFLLPGAVMFCWLLGFNQWHRLRPFHLPSGAALFLAVAAPWHVLAAQHNPDWARFYFVHEHWARFTTTTHGRVQPWWFFIPLVVLGLFPWTGFAWSAVRDSFAGGWARRREHALPGFFALWALVIFVFFSLSQSKLAPYVLPVFPPLAALLGVWLARENTSGPERLRPGLWIFVFTAGLLAGAVSLVVISPATAHVPSAQANTLRPMAITIALTLLAGAGTVAILVRLARTRVALAVMVVVTGAFYITLASGAALIAPSGTRDIAGFVRAALPADAQVFHYGDFFHDFVFYAKRFVGTVEFYGDEMELVNDPAARASGRFINEDKLRELWRGEVPIYVVVRKKKLTALQEDYRRAWAAWKKSGADDGATDPAKRPRPPVLIDRACKFQILYETADHLLVTNVSHSPGSSD